MLTIVTACASAPFRTMALAQTRRHRAGCVGQCAGCRGRFGAGRTKSRRRPHPRQHRGFHRIHPYLVRTRAGEPFDPATAQEDYQRIFGLRKFSNVEAKVEPTATGGVIVVFVVSEQKQSVKFLIAEISESTNTTITPPVAVAHLGFDIGEFPQAKDALIVFLRGSRIERFAARVRTRLRMDAVETSVLPRMRTSSTLQSGQRRSARDIRRIGRRSRRGARPGLRQRHRCERRGRARRGRWSTFRADATQRRWTDPIRFHARVIPLHALHYRKERGASVSVAGEMSNRKHATPTPGARLLSLCSGDVRLFFLPLRYSP